MTSDTAPVAAERRIELIDALRGFALAGVLLANLRDFSLYPLLSDAARAALPSAALDRWIDMALSAAIEGKAMTVFALLFGVGFALQLERSEDDARVRRRYAWRLALLLGFGLLHAWLWWGDILRYYALLGLLLLPLTRVRARTLAWLGVVLAVVATAALQPWMRGWSSAFTPGDQARAAAYAAFSGADWAGMLAGNLRYDLWLHATAWSLTFFTLGRLLLGMAIGRAGLLRDAAAHARSWRLILICTLPLGAALALYFALLDHGALSGSLFGLKGNASRALSRLLRNTHYLALGLAYLAGFVLLFQRVRGRRWMGWLAPVGRMALSNYLAQSLLGIGLFYGIGLGLGPRHGLIAIVPAFLAIFAAQVAFSRWWLARYRYGPAEWLWRCLTYRRRLPLRCATAPAPELRAGEAGNA